MALRYVNINKKWPRSVIRFAALVCEKALLILNIELIFLKFYSNFPFSCTTLCTNYFFSYEKDIEIDKPSYSCDKSVMHNGDL